MRKVHFVHSVVLALCVAPAVFGQQSNSLPALKAEAAKEVDQLQKFTQQMVDEIFSFSELASRNLKRRAT